MKNPNLTKVFYSTDLKKWFVRIDSIHFISKLPIDIKVSKKEAMEVIKTYEFQENKPFVYSAIK